MEILLGPNFWKMLTLSYQSAYPVRQAASSEFDCDGSKPMVLQIDGNTFVELTVVLDGHMFKNCHFEDCVLVYRGELTNLVNCRFIRCEVKLEGAADETLRWLSDMLREGSGVQEMRACLETIWTRFQWNIGAVTMPSSSWNILEGGAASSSASLRFRYGSIT